MRDSALRSVSETKREGEKPLEQTLSDRWTLDLLTDNDWQQARVALGILREGSRAMGEEFEMATLVFDQYFEYLDSHVHMERLRKLPIETKFIPEKEVIARFIGLTEGGVSDEELEMLTEFFLQMKKLSELVTFSVKFEMMTRFMSKYLGHAMGLRDYRRTFKTK